MASRMLSSMESSTTEGSTMTDDKIRENRLRRMAERQGLRIEKSRRRDPLAIDYGRWAVFAGDDRRAGNLTTEQVEEGLDRGEWVRMRELHLEIRRDNEEAS